MMVFIGGNTVAVIHTYHIFVAASLLKQILAESLQKIVISPKHTRLKIVGHSTEQITTILQFSDAGNK